MYLVQRLSDVCVMLFVFSSSFKTADVFCVFFAVAVKRLYQFSWHLDSIFLLTDRNEVYILTWPFGVSSVCVWVWLSHDYGQSPLPIAMKLSMGLPYFMIILYYVGVCFLSRIFIRVGMKDSVERGGGEAVRPQAEMRRVSFSSYIYKNRPGSLFIRLFTFNLVCLFSTQNNKTNSLEKNYAYVLQNIVYSNILVYIVHKPTQVLQ